MNFKVSGHKVCITSDYFLRLLAIEPGLLLMFFIEFGNWVQITFCGIHCIYVNVTGLLFVVLALMLGDGYHLQFKGLILLETKGNV